MTRGALCMNYFSFDDPRNSNRWFIFSLYLVFIRVFFLLLFSFVFSEMK